MSKYQVPEDCLQYDIQFHSLFINTNKIYVCRYIRKICIILYIVYDLIKIKHIHIDKAYLYKFYVFLPRILYHTISVFHIYMIKVYILYVWYMHPIILYAITYDIYDKPCIFIYFTMYVYYIHTCVCVLYIHTHFETKEW